MLLEVGFTFSSLTECELDRELTRFSSLVMSAIVPVLIPGVALVHQVCNSSGDYCKCFSWKSIQWRHEKLGNALK